MSNTTINYWEDDLEQHKEAPKKEQTCAWGVHTTTKTKIDDLEFPALISSQEKKKKDDEKLQVEKQNKKMKRLVRKSKSNMFEALVENSDSEQEEITNVDKKLHPIRTNKSMVKLPKPRRHINTSSRLCHSVTEGRLCAYGDRCLYAHHVENIIPTQCIHGQKCMSITVGYDRSVTNNKQSRRTCMFSHDECLSDYLKRTGLDKYAKNLKNKAPTLHVPGRFKEQAREMCRVTGLAVV